MDGAHARAEDLPAPDAVVDGGGEPWTVLGESITRRLEQMAVGEVLEIVSQERRNRADIPTWCYLSGHELLHMWTERDTTRFWIRKERA